MIFWYILLTYILVTIKVNIISSFSSSSCSSPSSSGTPPLSWLPPTPSSSPATPTSASSSCPPRWVLLPSSSPPRSPGNAFSGCSAHPTVSSALSAHCYECRAVSPCRRRKSAADQPSWSMRSVYRTWTCSPLECSRPSVWPVWSSPELSWSWCCSPPYRSLSAYLPWLPCCSLQSGPSPWPCWCQPLWWVLSVCPFPPSCPQSVSPCLPSAWVVPARSCSWSSPGTLSWSATPRSVGCETRLPMQQWRGSSAWWSCSWTEPRGCCWSRRWELSSIWDSW